MVTCEMMTITIMDTGMVIMMVTGMGAMIMTIAITGSLVNAN